MIILNDIKHYKEPLNALVLLELTGSLTNGAVGSVRPNKQAQMSTQPSLTFMCVRVWSSQLSPCSKIV